LRLVAHLNTDTRRGDEEKEGKRVKGWHMREITLE